MMIKLVYLATVSLAAMIAASSAAAQPAPPSSRLRPRRRRPHDGLPGGLFAPFAPRTALDIAKRVPGFTLDLGATQTDQGQVDVRGFAGTAGNVVINGARPSSKAETLDVDARANPRPAGAPGRGWPRRSVRLRLCRQEPGAEYHHVGQGGIDAQCHRRRRALVHRLRQHRHLGLGADQARGFDHQPVRRDRPQPPASGRPRLRHRRRHRRARRAPAEVQQLLQQGSLSVGELGARAGRRTRRSASTRRWQPSQFRPVPEQPRHADRTARRTTTICSSTIAAR